MKRKFKTLSTLSVVSLLLLGNITNVCANDFSNIVVSSNINEISNKYNLKDIDISELPEGIIPIEVDANNLESELLKFNNLIDSNIKNKSILPNVDIPTTYAAGIFTQKFSHSFGFFKSNLTANITQDNKKITRVSTPSLTLSGFTLSYDISNINTNSYIDSLGKNAYVDVDYQLDYYLLVDGGIKLFSRDISQGFTYTYDKGITSYYVN